MPDADAPDPVLRHGRNWVCLDGAPDILSVASFGVCSSLAHVPAMRVLVCGGRKFSDAAFARDVLGRAHAERGPFTLVITGMARGADAIAEAWAADRGIPHRGFPADWSA